MKREYRGQRSVVAIADFIRQQQVDPVKELLLMEEANTVDVSGERALAMKSTVFSDKTASFLLSPSTRGAREISSATLRPRTLITTTRMKRSPTSSEMTAPSPPPLGEPPDFQPFPGILSNGAQTSRMFNLFSQARV